MLQKRYVAGYCLSVLKKKCVNIRNTNKYSKTSDGQSAYENAKCALQILSVLKEEEHFLKKNTSDPESLIDLERRQYSSGKLINVMICVRSALVTKMVIGFSVNRVIVGFIASVLG